jgi:hypothetical protein
MLMNTTLVKGLHTLNLDKKKKNKFH